MLALLEPLVDISGEKIGCADPDDDHILELAIKAKARFIVARDNAILNSVYNRWFANFLTTTG